jgi:GNAT superfamily N-acetyltransferase
VIRPSGRDEAETHFAVQRAACIDAFPDIFPPDLYPFPDDAVRERWLNASGTVLVVERDGTVAGVAAVESCWLNGFYVIPAYWGTGVAEELHAAAVALQPDCGELRLWVLEGNRRARRFYEKHGWLQNGETRVVEYPPHPIDVGYSYARGVGSTEPRNRAGTGFAGAGAEP